MISTCLSKSEQEKIITKTEQTMAEIATACSAIGEVIFGQKTVIEHAMIVILSGGHALLIGLPGLAKTRLVETLGIVLGLQDQRIQFTPDLMPADILGSEILQQHEDGNRSFRFLKGPIFTQLLMADEINRASPRTQAALLQAMQETHITIAGQRHGLAHSISRFSHPKSTGTGRNLPASRGTTGSLYDADKCSLSR